MKEACTPGTSGTTGELLSLLERFDRAWRGELPPRIDEFLPPVSDVATAEEETLRRSRLEELIPVDLEYRWRRAGRSVRAIDPGIWRERPECGFLARTPASGGLPGQIPRNASAGAAAPGAGRRGIPGASPLGRQSGPQ